MTSTDELADYDVAVIGGGLSGSITATLLGEAGYRVLLIDRYEEFPSEFRVEKIAGDQIDKLDRLGLLDPVATAATRFDEIVNLSRGRVLDRTRATHYGILYDTLVSTMRRQIPQGVHFVVGRVADVSLGAQVQAITVRDRGPMTARLIVLATGLGDVLRARVGINRHLIHERQSLTFGFNIRAGAPGFGHPSLTYYGERPADGIDYLNMFPIGHAMRANLFTFRSHTDPWVKALRRAPAETLRAALPGLVRRIGDFEVNGELQVWLQDLSVARNVEQAGIVLVGDAYQTSCPAAGTGVSRLLTDVEQLCRVHIPDWFATPGMGAEKIARFYADPVKQAMDARALALAHYRRNLTIDTRLGWRLHRGAAYAQRRFINGLDRLSPEFVTRLRGMRAGTA